MTRSDTTAPDPFIDATDHPISVLIVDDHVLLAESIVRALRVEGFVAEAVEPASVLAVVEQASLLRPTAVLTDLDLGSTRFDGLDLIGPLVLLGIKVVVLTRWRDRLLAAASLEAGATAIVSKSRPFSDVVGALKAAAIGAPAPDPVEQDSLRRELRQFREAYAERLAPFGRLSRRERDVLTSLVEGRSAEAIAATSYVSLATVRSQIQAVLRKLDVNSQLEAVAAATRCGWSGHEPKPMVRYSSTLHL